MTTKEVMFDSVEDVKRFCPAEREAAGRCRRVLRQLHGGRKVHTGNSQPGDS